MVGASRFELPPPCAQGRCATRLRYAPSKTRAILHTEGTKSRFCGTCEKLRQDLYQLLERFASMADLCFRFAVKFAESFSQRRVKKQWIIPKAVRTNELQSY